MATEARGEIASTLETQDHVLERAPQEGVVRRRGKSAHATQQRNARLRDRVHLAGEENKIGGPRAAEAGAPCELADVGTCIRAGVPVARNDLDGCDAPLSKARRDAVR